MTENDAAKNNHALFTRRNRVEYSSLRLRVAGIRAVVESRAQELNELQRSGLMRVFGVRFGSELKEVSLVLFVPHASISP